jgi:hypothetical protein
MVQLEYYCICYAAKKDGVLMKCAGYLCIFRSNNGYIAVEALKTMQESLVIQDARAAACIGGCRSALELPE